MLLEEIFTVKDKTIELDILGTLSDFCTDIKTHEVMSGQMIINSAYLLNRNRKEKSNRNSTFATKNTKE